MVCITLRIMNTPSSNRRPHASTAGAGASPAREADDAASLAARSPVARLSSRQLLGSAGEVEIAHAGSIYRLRLTSLGKLILTK